MSWRYGGTPWHWIAEVPLGLFEKCTTLLDRLEAEDNLRWVERIGIGSGMRTYKDPKTGRELADLWREAAKPDEAERPRHYRTADEIRALGFKVFSPAAQP